MNTQIRISKKHNVAVLPYCARVAGLIPHNKKFAKGGTDFIMVPAGKEELQLLRNLGYETPSPMQLDYDWCGMVPFDSQMMTADMLIHSPRAYVLNEMGTGKTLSALFAYDYLKKHKLVRKMLVVAPLSTLTTVWEREVFTRLPHLTTQSLWHPTAARRRQYLEADADIFVINHDGLGTIMPELLAKEDIDVVLIDELAIFRKKSTDRWKRTNAICQGKKFVWGMTGSPTPKAPSDAWAQTVLITPDRVPKYFRQFRDRVETQVSQFRWIPKQDANDTVHDAMQPCVRYTREDCLDLPETMYTTREVAFTKEQTTLYKQMVASSYAKYLDGEINAANAGIVTSKLLQISCGIAYDIHGETIHVPSKPRMTELEGILEGNEHKIIVFVPFIKAVDAVFDMVIAAGYDAARIYGATPKTERDQTFNLFQNSPSIQVLVAHPQTMAHGLTLTAADTIVWYSPTPSLEIYEQANARITRPGQKNRTHIVHIESSPIERKIYKNLTNRGHVQSVLLDMFAETTPQNLQAI